MTTESPAIVENQTSSDIAEREFVRVPITNRPGVYAKVDRGAFDRFAASGRSLSWFLNENGRGSFYVRFSAPEFVGQVETVARVLIGAGRGEQVEYVNGDRLDLRRENLRIGRSGKARGQTPARDEFSPPPVAKVETPASSPAAPPAPRRSKPLDMIVTRPPNPRMRPEGTMGLPEATSGFAFAPA